MTSFCCIYSRPLQQILQNLASIFTGFSCIFYRLYQQFKKNEKCFKNDIKMYIFRPFFPYRIILTYPNFPTILGKIVVLPPGFDLGNPGLLGQRLIHCSITSLMKSLGQLVIFDGKYRIQSQAAISTAKHAALPDRELCYQDLQKKILPLSTDSLMFYYSQKQQITVLFAGLPLDDVCIYVQTFSCFITAKSRKLKYFLQEFLCIKAVLWLYHDFIHL